jgi:hypothetical protein
MGLLQDIVHAITGGHPAAQAQQPIVDGHPVLPMAQAAHLQPMQPMAPMAPRGNASPQSQALYQDAMNNYMKLSHQFTPAQAHTLSPGYTQSQNYASSVQGQQNPGLIPMQGSAFSHNGVGMTRGVQGASYAPIQAGNYNPQPNINF